MRKQAGIWLLLVGLGLASLLIIQCRSGDSSLTPTPTKTRVVLALATNTPIPTPTLQPSPTASSFPTASATATLSSPIPPSPTDAPPTETRPAPSATSSPLPPTETATQTPTAGPTNPPPPAVGPTAQAQPPLPPQQGGEWDMETGFEPGVSPLGEDCPGWAVAVGWQAFLAPGNPASSCLNENKNSANVKSGDRSQEITFDFVSAEAGIYKRAKTIPGHRYRIEAWGKHVRSQSPVQLSLGVDLTAGEIWQAASVTYYPWDEVEEDVWVHTQVAVQARGDALTVFLKGFHPFAAQGGATLFDDVRVVDLGH